MAIARKPASQLAGGRGLARALEPDDQEDARRLIGISQLGFVAAQDLDQFLMNDLDDLLGGRKRGHHFLAHGLRLDVLDELLDHPEIDVGFQQRHANFTQGALHIFGRELAFATQVLENPLQFIREVVEHDYAAGGVAGAIRMLLAAIFPVRSMPSS